MDVGTNSDVLGRGSKTRDIKKKKAGRPKINRALVIRNLKAKDSAGLPMYTKSQIARLMKCTPKTINRIYKFKNRDLTKTRTPLHHLQLNAELKL